MNMNILSPEFLTMIVLGSLFCILIKITRINRGLRGITINNKFKKKTPLLISAAIIIVTILLLVTSSGCATKEPTIINKIDNNNEASQIASEKTSSEPITSKETATEPSTEKVSLAEKTTSSDQETQTITPKTKPDIEIIHPVERTNWQENIGGIAKNIPDGYELWILVYSHEKEQYYPYTKVVPEYNQWVIKPLIIGFKGDYVKSFDIIAVLADTAAQEEFNNYLNKAEENEENIYSQGLYLIPDGAKEYSRVTLERRNMFEDSTVD